MRAHARSAGNQVVRLDLGNQPLQRSAEQLAAEAAAELIPAGAAVFPEKSPQSGKGKRVGQIGEVDIVFGVTFARERQHRVRSGFDAARDPAREMDTEKREARVGNRVDQVAHQELTFRPDQIILASKGHDPHRALLSGELRHAIRVQPGAGHQKIAGRFAGSVTHAPATRITMKGGHACAGYDFPALLPDQTRQRLAHGRIVGDAFLRDVNRLHAARMRLDLAQFFATEHAQPRQAVLASALEQIVQARHFVGVAATTTLPHTSCWIPCVWQNSTIWPMPRTARRARRDPGL